MYQTTTTAAANHTIIYLLLFETRITDYYIGKKALFKSSFDFVKYSIL